MRITYLASIRLPTEKAHGLQIMKTCEALASIGNSVELIVPTRKNAIDADPFEYYGVLGNFRIITVRVPDLVRFGPLGFLVSAVWFSEKAHLVRSFWTADIVYSRDALVLFQYLLLGRPFVFEVHARPSFVSAIVARRARKLIVISAGLKHAYESIGVAPEKIIVAPDAVDEHLFDNAPQRIEARVALGLPEKGKIALYAGHLYERKGVETLAATAALLPEVLFVFVGGTSEDVARFKGKWGKQSNIRIVGHMPHAAIPRYLRAADVLVLPNSGKDVDSARYTSPMKLFEYMAAGLPIVASDLPSIREILSEHNAFLVTPDDARSLASAITGLLENPEKGAVLARQARTDVEQYTWNKRAEHICAFLSRDRA